MIRRSLAVGALALAGLALAVPASAGPVYPDESTLACSTTQVTPNQTFTCTVTRTQGTGTHAQLTTNFSGGDATISGVVSAVKPLSGNAASFTVTAPSVLGNISITSGVGPEGGPYLDSITTAAVVVVDSMASTGFDGTPLAIAAGALLVVGAGAVGLGAYRRRQDA